MRATSWPAVVMLALCAGGCVPHVAHGPRVEPGRQYFVSGSLLRSPSLQDDNIAVIPSVFAGGNRGWVFGNGVAASLGVQVPIFALPFVLLADSDELDEMLSLVMVDAYVQPRRAVDGGIDFGIGAMASTGTIAPYLQLGRAGDGGIYTTQALAWTHGAFNPVLYWQPSVSMRAERPDGSRAVNYFLSGLVGWPRNDGRVSERDREWAVSVGVVLELTRPRGPQ